MYSKALRYADFSPELISVAQKTVYLVVGLSDSGTRNRKSDFFHVRFLSDFRTFSLPDLRLFKKNVEKKSAVRK